MIRHPDDVEDERQAQERADHVRMEEADDEGVPRLPEAPKLALLTSSRMRAFRTCPRLHQFSYVERYRPAREPEYFRVGTLVHAGLEAWWQAVEQGANADRLAFALSAVAGLAFDWPEQIRVEEMLRGYEAAWGPEAEAYEVIAVEAVFEAPLLNPATMAASRTFRLAGKVDVIVRRRADGRVLVVEHKTTGEQIEDDGAHYWSTLALDHQISAYVIGAESLGHVVDEILYDVIRKPAERPLKATPVEARKYVKATGLLYANQREFDETEAEYRERVRAKIAENPARTYARRAIPRTNSQIRDFLADAWQQARSMRDLELAGFAPRNPEACHRFGTCSYWSACSAGIHPGQMPTEFTRVADPHPELNRGSAEVATVAAGAEPATN